MKVLFPLCAMFFYIFKYHIRISKHVLDVTGHVCHCLNRGTTVESVVIPLYYEHHVIKLKEP